MTDRSTHGVVADDLIVVLERSASVTTSPCGAGRIVWRTWGQGTPLLLIHGGFGSWLHWIRNIEWLRARHRVIAVDLPGLGDSTEAPQPHSAEAIARLLFDGLTHLVPPPASLSMAGFSLGGAIAVPLAEMLQARVRNLYLCGPTGIGDMWRNVTEGLQRRRPDMTDDELRGLAYDSLALTMIADPARIDALALRIQHRLLGQKRYLKGQAISQTDVVFATLPRLHRDTRVTIVWGERDAYLHAGARKCRDVVQQRFPQVAVEIMPRAGHWVHYEAADRVNAVLSNPFVDKTYAEAVVLLATRYGDRLALRHRGRSWSFRELKEEVDRASARLSTLGLAPGDKVAIWMPNRPEYLWYWLGAAQIGLVAVLLNTRLKAAEITYQLRHSETRVVVIPGAGSYRDFVGDLVAICPEATEGAPDALQCQALPDLRSIVCIDPPGVAHSGITDWSTRAPKSDAPLAYATDPTLPAQIAYTSGTTALPKAVLLTHCVWRKAADHGSRFGQTADDRLYLCVPLFGVLGNVNGAMTFWSRGSSVVLEDRFEAETALRAIATEQCTALYLIPMMVEQLIAHPRRAKYDLRSLRTGLVSSSDPEILRATVVELGMREMFSSYGMTETSSAVTRTFSTDPLDVRIGTQGRPLPDIAVRIADPQSGAELPAGEFGEIQVKGYCVTPGYYKDPEATRAAFTADGWFRTRDGARLRDDGYLEFAHRLGDGYKHKGFIVSSAEVESVLQTHPEVETAAVLGVPDRTHGEIGIAFVVRRSAATLDAESVLDYLRPRLASYKLPRHVFPVDDLPRTGGTGRVQKFKLKHLAIDLIAQNTAVSLDDSNG